MKQNIRILRRYVQRRKTIKEAKSKREPFSGALQHKDQCEQIPSEFVDESHGVHLEPCYKK